MQSSTSTQENETDTTALNGKAPDLTTRVRALPQELIDQIRDEVFTCTTRPKLITHHRVDPASHNRHFCHKKYLILPDTASLLHVSKATRAQFITSYYTNAVLAIQGIAAARLWLESLAPEHKNLIEEVRVASYVYIWDKFSTDSALRTMLFPGSRDTDVFAEKFRRVTLDELLEALD